MADPSSAITLVPKGYEQVDPEMELFLDQVKTIQTQEDLAAMPGPEHIGGCINQAKYFNMNPFEVLGLTHKATPEEVRGAYGSSRSAFTPTKIPATIAPRRPLRR